MGSWKTGAALVCAIVMLIGCSAIGGETDSEQGTTGSGSTPEALPVTADQLMNAWIPSVCRHEAGHLVDGVLPVEDERKGSANIAGVGGGKRPAIVIGDVTGDGVDDGVADIVCNAGGVGWPSTLVFYTNGSEYLGSVHRSDIVDNPGRGPVDELTIEDGWISFSWYGPKTPSEPACCPTQYLKARLMYDGTELVVADIQLDRLKDRDELYGG
ncbi:hypothetical protein [Corynebacterium sp. CCM 9204]|uniref:hypothetical protein n=1 Tax=Corynebacterium sp. CCM 9204 TaxID=3057616 RepID=UPI003523B89F